MKRLPIYLIFLAILISFANITYAANDFSKHFYFSEIDEGGYIGSLDDNFHISFPKDTYTKDIDVYISNSTVQDLPMGEKIGEVYSYYILTQEKPTADFELAVKFDSDNQISKHLWLYDYKTNTWQKLFTRVDWAGRLAIAKTSSHYGKIVLMQESIMKYNSPVDGYDDYSGDFSIKLNSPVFDTIEIQKFNIDLYPQEFERLSDIYQYDIKGLDLGSSFIDLTIKYDIKNWQMPTAYYWDKNAVTWIELPTLADIDNSLILVKTPLMFSRIALFNKPDVWVGEASWYKYKDCDCAASRDYPKGTKLKVTHLSSNKQVTVVVNDFGPELWTNRIIDLDATAFAKFGSLRWGLTNVKIELEL